MTGFSYEIVPYSGDSYETGINVAALDVFHHRETHSIIKKEEVYR
jgi:hypothetical protein